MIIWIADYNKEAIQMTMNQNTNNGDSAIAEEPTAIAMFRRKYGPWALMTGPRLRNGPNFYASWQKTVSVSLL